VVMCVGVCVCEVSFAAVVGGDDEVEALESRDVEGVGILF
jgi:hypothetical protein